MPSIDPAFIILHCNHSSVLGTRVYMHGVPDKNFNGDRSVLKFIRIHWQRGCGVCLENDQKMIFRENTYNAAIRCGRHYFHAS